MASNKLLLQRRLSLNVTECKCTKTKTNITQTKTKCTVCFTTTITTTKITTTNLETYLFFVQCANVLRNLPKQLRIVLMFITDRKSSIDFRSDVKENFSA